MIRRPRGPRSSIRPAAKSTSGEAKFKGGDEIMRVGDAPVNNYREFAAELARHADQTLRVTVRRNRRRVRRRRQCGQAAAEASSRRRN